jgi:carbon monoxide dehydrogenase subunit G
MELKNSFAVEQPVEEAWVILNDLERIAPCLPGARITEIEGDEYRGLMKVKVGPIVAKYEGTATFTARDDKNRVATIKAAGRDPRQGNADAEITAALTAESESATRVDLVTDLSLAGKLASFGKGAIEDVSANILDQFSENLSAMLARETAAPEPAAPAPEPAAASQSATGPRYIEGPEPEPIDLGAVAAAPMLKRALPVLVGFALGLLVGTLCLRRRR